MRILTGTQMNFHIATPPHHPRPGLKASCAYRTLIILLLGSVFTACSQPMAVSVNNRAVYDPGGRLLGSEVLDADLQGCINLALRQQNLDSPSQLSVLSCANSEIRELDNIGQLIQLRFLDLGNNLITNITPLENLRQLSGLNLAGNQVNDISPLLNIPSLTSVILDGNPAVPCDQLASLRQQLGDNLSEPAVCSD